MNRRGFLFGCFALTPFALLLADGQQPRKTTYTNDVAPVFKAHCGSCHGGGDPAAHLDLTTTAGIIKGGVSGPLFVAGKPDESLLLRRLLGTDGKPRMPMGFPPLSNDSTQRIRDWLAGGAQFDPGSKKVHWAYCAPIRPPVPTANIRGWARNPIDNFILAGLEREGLRLSPEASKETLIRRVSLDLIGLPPTPKEIDAFLADKRPDAYERLVDRLLASPHYGERQARPWLDLARYADSDGYEKDQNRIAWKYRDWVIDAYNRNLPYDQFTVEQLAGDLLPYRGSEPLMATGFHRNTQFNREGGVDQAEANFNVIVDRVNTTAEVWLGSTLQCARCHNHKYDPFSQKDYYSLAAFFSNQVIFSEGKANPSDDTWLESQIPVPTGRQVAEQERLGNEIRLAERALKGKTTELDVAFQKWTNSIRQPVAWTPMMPLRATADRGTILTPKPDGSILASGKEEANDVYHVSSPLSLVGATSLRLETLTDSSLGEQGPGRQGNFVLTKVAVKVDGKEAPISRATADFTQNQFDASRVIPGDKSSGWAIAPQTGKTHALILALTHPLNGKKLSVDLEFNSKSENYTLGRFRLSLSRSETPEAEVLAKDLIAIARQDSPTQESKSRLESFFREQTPLLGKQRSQIAGAKKQLDELRAQIPTAMIMQDKPAKGPLTAWVRSRGEFLSKTEEVVAKTPAALPPMPVELPRNRLGLAKWIVQPNNPLTARVQVNRMWEQVFGRGIVETSEDFGTQGSKPTNPELLDWLASEFVRLKWDMKALNRLIVTSATYRQSSNATPELLRRDPQNILLARGPRFRMEAEMLRDAALVEGGLLNPKIGGPSVYPSQPEGVWNTPYNDEKWMTSTGGDEYRRGLYSFWKRSSPYASFMAFDATSREECTVRRIRTNTPLQALAMLNDQAFFTAAKALREKMLKAGAETADRLSYGFRACTGRRPTQTEIGRLEKLLGRVKARYASNPLAAQKLGGTPTVAAYTMTANVLMNLDETLTKG